MANGTTRWTIAPRRFQGRASSCSTALRHPRSRRGGSARIE
jgi:hypothetical protein